jgi:hypothetical protein
LNTRAALLGSFMLSLLLTGCPLTDHYQLMSGDAGSTAGGAVDQAGQSSGGAAPLRAGAGGAGAGAENTAGEAGESGISGAPNAGSAGAVIEVAGGAGAAAGGAPTAGSGGALVTGGGGGTAGGSGCAVACTAQESCCGTGCVDLTMDALNCGACNAACNSGRTCAASTCKGGWVSMAAPPMGFVARSRAAVVAMGKSAFFWGGQDANGNALDTGAIYAPNKNQWTFVPKDPGAPSARMMASAVWTGNVVIVFGGTDANGNPFRDGAIYDPSSAMWTPLPANPMVGRRSAPSAFWDGTRAFFWGGLNSMGGGIPNADRFDLTNWSISTNAGDPGALLYPAVGFDGAVMYLAGGQLNNNRQDKVYSYAASTDSWSAIAKSTLSTRSSGFGVWDGAHFVVWGGRDDFGLKSDGSYLSGTKWTLLSTFGAPSARMIAFRRSGWAFQTAPGVVAIVGGQVSLVGAGTLTTTGAYYNVASATWTAIPGWPSAEAHDYGMGVWTGEEFVLWGGRDSNGVTTTGERWAP